MIRGGKAEAIFSKFLRKTLEDSNEILDIGTSQRFAKELRPFESWFAAKNYLAAGFCPSDSLGKYNCDLHQDIEEMTFENERFDAIICLEVLEHVKNPFRASEELFRVLRKNGKLLLTVPFLAQYHGKGSFSQSHDGYPDFWRFTHEGLNYLFRSFSHLEIFSIDGPIEFRLKQIFPEPILALKPFRKLLDAIDRPAIERSTTRFLLFGEKIG